LKPFALVTVTLKYAQRLEIYKNAVRQRRQRFTRMVTAAPDTPPSSPERRVTKGDRSQQKTPQPSDTLVNQSRQNNHTSQSNKSNKKEQRSGNKRACATSVGNEDKWKDELLRKVQELETSQQKLNAENSALNKEVERLRYLEQLRSVPAPAASSSATAQAVKQLLPPSTTGQPRACFSCGNTGHIARCCPQKTASGEATMRSRGIFERNRSHETYLRVAIGNQVYDCLLDSGSEISLFPESVIGSTVMEITDMTIRAANGTEIPILGEVNLNLEIGDYTTRVVGMVSDRIQEPVLGIDFMTRNKVIWDFDEGTIWIANKPYLLHHRSNRSSGDESTRSDVEQRSSAPMQSHLSCASKEHQPKNDHGVKAISAARKPHVKPSNAHPAVGIDLKFWSLEELCAAQKADPDISHILNLMEASLEKPPWDSVSSQTYDVRVLWETWPRLRVWNGVLQRRFESPDGSATTWQVILPRQMRSEFLYEMIDAHLSRKRTAVSIQAKAYWPTWSSDMNAFWKERRPCGESAPYERMKNAPSKLFLDHETRRPIDDMMGLSPDVGNAATTPHLNLRDDVDKAYRLARETPRASAVHREGHHNVKKSGECGSEDWKSCRSRQQLKKCHRPTPIYWVSVESQ